MRIQKTLWFLTLIQVVIFLFNNEFLNLHFLSVNTEKDFFKFKVGVGVGSSSVSLFWSKSLLYRSSHYESKRLKNGKKSKKWKKFNVTKQRFFYWYWKFIADSFWNGHWFFSYISYSCWFLSSKLGSFTKILVFL